jgi:hypothetical protein
MKAPVKIGKPSKVPTDEQLARLDMVNLVIGEAKIILKECKAPASWGDGEIKLILRCAFCPSELNSVLRFPNDELKAHRTSNALAWGRMFAQAPDAMVDALPKIRTLVKKSQGIPASQKKRTVNVCDAVVEHYVLSNTFGHYQRQNLGDSKRFWIGETKAVALEYSKYLDLPVTQRTIEDAREKLRKRIEAFPPI